MVDLALLQSLSYMAGAIGVCIAAIYYMMNLRVQQRNLKEVEKNRRITLTTTLMEPFFTKEGLRDFITLMSMEWNDLDDFKKRYDSRVNPDNFAMRMAMWNRCDNLGLLYREGLLDLKTLDTGSGSLIQYMWTKFKSIIEMYRKTEWMSFTYSDFQYVAEQLIEYDRVRGDSEEGRWNRVLQEHAKNPQ